MSADLTCDRSQSCVSIPHNSQRDIRPPDSQMNPLRGTARFAFHTVSQSARSRRGMREIERKKEKRRRGNKENEGEKERERPRREKQLRDDRRQPRRRPRMNDNETVITTATAATLRRGANSPHPGLSLTRNQTAKVASTVTNTADDSRVKLDLLCSFSLPSPFDRA